MSPCRGTSVREPEGKGQQWHPSHGLERPGLGTLSHRAEQETGQGGAEWGDMTRRKRSGYQETQADKKSEAGGAGTRTTTVETRTRPMATRRSPQITGEKMWKRSRRYTKSRTHVGRANRGGKGRRWWGKRRQGAGVRRDPMCAAQCPTSLTRSPASHRQ